MIDSTGRKWLVYEAILAYDRRAASLIFESGDIMRRLREYPADWWSMSVADLVQLGEQGRPD